MSTRRPGFLGMNPGRIGDWLLILTCATVLGMVVLRYVELFRIQNPRPFVVAGDSFWDSSITPVADRLVVIYAVSTCTFCTASIPFYREIIDEQGRGKTYTVRFLTTEPLEQFRQYMATHGLPSVDVELRDSFGRIPGTPSLVIIDGNRRVHGAWTGRLKPAEEQEVRILLGITGA